MANPEKIVTRELVFEVADRLKAQGIEPTNRKVLHETGGSLTTIASHLRDWKAQQDIPAPAKIEATLPPTVAEIGLQSVAAIWQACAAEARKDFEVVTEQANQRVKAAEEERDRVLTELGEAETDLNTEREEVARLTPLLAQEREQRAKLQEQNNHLQSETEKAAAVVLEVERRAASLLESLTHAREEESRLQSISDRQAREVEQLRAALDTERQQREKAELSCAARKTELATAEANNSNLTEKIADLKKSSTAEILRISEKMQKLEAENLAARRHAEESAVECGTMKGQVETLRKQVDSQTTIIKGFSPLGDKKTK